VRYRVDDVAMRKVFLVLSGLLLLAVVLQFYFAAYGAFTLPLPKTIEQHNEAFKGHSVNANIIMLLSLLTMIAAFLAGTGWRTAILALVPGLLVIGQILIFIISGAAGGDPDAIPPTETTASHIIVAFHAINGLAIMGAAIAVLRRAIMHDRAGQAGRVAATGMPAA
jgi:hypothetical protein